MSCNPIAAMPHVITNDDTQMFTARSMDRVSTTHTPVQHVPTLQWPLHYSNHNPYAGWKEHHLVPLAGIIKMLLKAREACCHGTYA